MIRGFNGMPMTADNQWSLDHKRCYLCFWDQPDGVHATACCGKCPHDGGSMKKSINSENCLRRCLCKTFCRCFWVDSKKNKNPLGDSDTEHLLAGTDDAVAMNAT